MERLRRKDRGEHDFAERDRLMLNLLRSHLVQAYRNAEAVGQMQRKLALALHVIEKLDHGVIALSQDGRIQWATLRARQLLTQYFGSRSHLADCLPEDLRQWVAHQMAFLGAIDELCPPRKPLAVEHQGSLLLVRLVGEPAEGVLLMLEERLTTVQPASLEPLGLTRREAEVLTWVIQGKTNPEIGLILAASPRTVEKHLEHIFEKLGVATRTAAATYGLQAAISPLISTPVGRQPGAARPSFT